MYQPTAADLALLDHDLAVQVIAGDLQMLSPDVWKNPQKPVLRKNGKVAKGSGQLRGAMDMALVSKIGAPKRRASYRELKERYINPDDERDPDALMSFKQLTDTLLKAAQGSPQKLTCPDCGAQNILAFKQDAAVLYKLWENFVGRPDVTTDVNIHSSQTIELLHEQIPIYMQELPSGEEAHRRSVLRGVDVTGT